MKYEGGSRKFAIEELIRCAIQDRVALRNAHIDWDGNPINQDKDTLETIADCEAAIRDFTRLEKTLR